MTTQTYTLTVTRAAQLSVVSIAADTTRTTIDIGTASFTLTRTGPTTDSLTVDVEVTEEFRYVAGALPTTATFAANESEAKLEFNRLWGSGTPETGDLTVTIQDGTGYEVSATAASASIEVVVLDLVMTFRLDAGGEGRRRGCRLVYGHGDRGDRRGRHEAASDAGDGGRSSHPRTGRRLSGNDFE